MNLLDSTEETSGEVLFVNFNQDCTSLSVGSKKGFRVYSFPTVDELKVIHESSHEDVRIVERLFSSSLVAVVSSSAPRKLKVCHFKKGTEICNYSYSNTILAVKLNRQRLVVCLEESLYIHNIRDMKVLHTIRDTPPNPKGLCVLSPALSLLAYPGSAAIGEVQVFDALNLQAKSMIPAHDNPLAAMAFDPTGTKLATASEKGTVIRVFNVLDGSKLYEFRRGVKRCARIYSLSFSEDSTFLSASSNTETVHIFKLDDIKDTPKENCGGDGGDLQNQQPQQQQGWLGYLGKALLQSASYLPAQVADMLCQGRAFATLHLPTTGKRNLCAIAKIEDALRVVVVSGEGVLYVHDLEPLEGGDCPLLHTHTLLEGSGVPSSPPDNSDLPSVPDSPRRTFQPGGASYASIVRGGESGALAQDPAAEESIPKDTLPQRNYENDFPPMSHEG